MDIELVFGNAELASMPATTVVNGRPDTFCNLGVVVTRFYGVSGVPAMQGFGILGSGITLNYETWKMFCERFQYPDFAEKSNVEMPIALRMDDTLLSAEKLSLPVLYPQFENKLMQLFAWMLFWYTYTRDHCEYPAMVFYTKLWLEGGKV